jgi:hypothetical protein
MLHLDLNHSSASPLKSSASAAALDSLTWDADNDDPYGTTTSSASAFGTGDGLGDAHMDSTGQLLHTQEFRPEEFLNDDLGDVMHLTSGDVDGVGDGLDGLDPLGIGSTTTTSLQPPSLPQQSTSSIASNATVSPTHNTAVSSPGAPPSSTATDPGFLASPVVEEGDRSSSLSPLPDTASPSGQGEIGSLGEGREEKEAEALAEEPRKEEEEEEETVGGAKVQPSREITPLSPLTPAADDLDGEGDAEAEEKKETEKKPEENHVTGKSIPQQKQPPLQPQQQRLHQQGRQTTKSPLGLAGVNVATALLQSHHSKRPSPDTVIHAPDLISPSAANARDPKVVKVLDLNVELFK